MFRRGIASFLLLSCALGAPAAQAYQLTPPEYRELAVLPAWDNEGRLPEGSSRRSELEWIDNDIESRAERLKARESMVLRMEQQARNPDSVKSLRADYEAQLESFGRWRESMERRRQAILDSAELHPVANRLPPAFAPPVGN